MDLEAIGFSNYSGKVKIENYSQEFIAGRIIAEHKERYICLTSQGEYEAEITGNLRFTARGREDFPAVGDWVALKTYEQDFAIIHQVFPRFSVIKRRAVSRQGETQVIAANIDVAFLFQALDRDFNINRLERYLTICNESNVKPVIILTKLDLVSKTLADGAVESIRHRIPGVEVMAISNETGEGYDSVTGIIEKGKTYCLLGSSGVGKSSFTNRISGTNLMKTDRISESTKKGRHVTSHREMIVLQNGGLLIDNPGMKEVGLTDSTAGLEMTFQQIINLGQKCRYTDCTHTGEAGCRVLAALENGELDPDSYENYMKMEREKAHYESSLLERRKKDREFGKMFKNYKKDMKKNDF